MVPNKYFTGCDAGDVHSKEAERRPREESRFAVPDAVSLPVPTVGPGRHSPPPEGGSSWQGPAPEHRADLRRHSHGCHLSPLPHPPHWQTHCCPQCAECPPLQSSVQSPLRQPTKQNKNSGSRDNLLLVDKTGEHGNKVRTCYHL